MAANGSTGSGIGLRLFFGFLIVATGALSVLVVRLADQNKMLRASIRKLEAAATAGGLIPGDIVDTIELRDGAGEPYLLDFGAGRPMTLFLLTSTACGACEQTVPVWEGVLTEVRPEEVRVVNVCAGVNDPAELGEEAPSSPMWQSYIAPAGREGWIRRIPVTPSALLINPDGSVLQRWYGSMSDAEAAQMRIALIDVSGG